METYVVHVTKECNCRCIYCYEKDKSSIYTWDEIRSFIDNLIEHRTSNEFTIEFLGGEPMLAFDLIKKVYHYIENIRKLQVDYVITTNGTILSDVVIKLLKDSKIHFAISMDGHRFSNQLRVFKDGTNTYEVVMENISKLLSEGIDFGIHIVSHPYNIAMLSDSIDHLYSKGVRSIDVGTIENTMQIDKDYCDRFISELNIVSEKIVSGEYKDLSIGLFNSVKPKEDIRTYMYDDNGKLIGESYGRSGEDITIKGSYDAKRCVEPSSVSDMIYHIRKTVYDNHQMNKSRGM